MGKKIRLFTAGKHNGLDFSDASVKEIAAKTAAVGPEMIPVVLGHPVNDLPVLGRLKKEALEVYQEDGKTSIGFDRDKAELCEGFSETTSGQNKISVRLRDGVIRHIGLVKKAAVKENNSQDFEALSGDFSGVDSFDQEDGTPSLIEQIKSLFINSNNSKSMEKEKETKTADFTALEGTMASLAGSVTALAEAMKADREKATAAATLEALTADFSAPEYSHLTDEQRKQIAGFCAGLTAVQQAEYKKTIAATNKKPATPPGGSVTADMGASGEKKTPEQIIKEQISAL